MFNNPDSLVVAISALFGGLTVMIIVPVAYHGIVAALRELKPSGVTIRNKH